MEQERRKLTRIPFYLEIEVWGRNDSHSIRNLSTSGVFIFTDKVSQYEPGDEIELILKLPTEEEAMLLRGVVSRVTEDGIGVKFLNLTHYYAKIIERCYTSYKDQLDSEG